MYECSDLLMIEFHYQDAGCAGHADAISGTGVAISAVEEVVRPVALDQPRPFNNSSLKRCCDDELNVMNDGTHHIRSVSDII